MTARGVGNAIPISTLTAVGRATVNALNLNHSHRQRIRKAEEAFALYPPRLSRYPSFKIKSGRGQVAQALLPALYVFEFDPYNTGQECLCHTRFSSSVGR